MQNQNQLWSERNLYGQKAVSEDDSKTALYNNKVS